MNLNLQTEQPASLTIIGAGAWGSALVNLAQKAGTRAQLWSRRSFQSLKSVTQDAEVILCATSIHDKSTSGASSSHSVEFGFL